MSKVNANNSQRELNQRDLGQKELSLLKSNQDWSKKHPTIKLVFSEQLSYGKARAASTWLSGEAKVKHFYARFEQDLRTSHLFAQRAAPQEGSAKSVLTFRVSQDEANCSPKLLKALYPSAQRSPSAGEFRAQLLEPITEAAWLAAQRVQRSTKPLLQGANN